MKLLIDPPFGDARLVAGESAVAGLAAALAAGLSPKLRQSLELDAKSKILVIGTEGATDAEIFSRLTGHQPDSGAQA
jgi:diaminopropionate ammonia-lyase